MNSQSSCFKRDRRRKATSNPEMKDSVERSRGTRDPRNTSPTFRTVGRSETSESKKFHRGMQEKEIKIEFFILEDSPSFAALTDKEKMLGLLQESSQDLRHWYYELGIEGKLPTKWNDFKKEVLEWCLDNDWPSLRRYIDEPWSSYIRRLSEKIGDGDERKVYLKLESENLPKDIKLITLTN